MTPSPTLQALIDEVKADAPGDEALLQLSQAATTVGDLEQVADALLGHFVDQCRRSGHSWSEISRALGVSKQAAHKRFTNEAPTFDRFTERARRVVRQAETEAHRLGHGFVGTEHLLLGLFEVPGSLAIKVLEAIGITKEAVEADVRELVKLAAALGGPDGATLPFTPRAKAVLRGAAEAALALGHNYIGTEHILLGLFVDEDSIAAQVLQDLGAGTEVVRARTLDLLAGYAEG